MMKLIPVLLLVFSVIACSPAKQTPVPEKAELPIWYLTQQMPHEPFEILGYGDGTSPEQAKKKARADIVKKINVIVSSNWEEIQKCRREKGKSLDCRYEAILEIKEKSSMELNDVRQVRIEEKGGIYYAILKYINLPIASKIAYELQESMELSCDRKNRSAYLSQTPLMKKLKRALGCEPPVSLERIQGRWYIRTGGISVKLSRPDFSELWSGKKDEAVSFAVIDNEARKPINRISKGRYYHFAIHPNQQGYLSLFSIYNTGQTVSMVPFVNLKVQAGRKLTYPDLDEYEGLIADIPPGQTTTQDLYLAVLCETKKDFDRFEPIDEALASQDAYRFGDLVRAIDGCRFSGQILHTRAKTDLPR